MLDAFVTIFALVYCTGKCVLLRFIIYCIDLHTVSCHSISNAIICHCHEPISFKTEWGKQCKGCCAYLLTEADVFILIVPTCFVIVHEQGGQVYGQSFAQVVCYHSIFFLMTFSLKSFWQSKTVANCKYSLSIDFNWKIWLELYQKSYRTVPCHTFVHSWKDFYFNH